MHFLKTGMTAIKVIDPLIRQIEISKLVNLQTYRVKWYLVTIKASRRNASHESQYSCIVVWTMGTTWVSKATFPKILSSELCKKFKMAT